MADKYSSAFLRQLNGKGGKTWQGVLKYKTPNQNFVERPSEGPDTRTANQKRREVWKQLTRCFDPAKVRTRSQATRALEAWRGETEKAAEEAETTSLYVPEYVARYIDAQTHIEASTLKGYRTILNAHIRPAFEGVPINKLTPKQITLWKEKLSTSGKSLSTVKKGFVLLKRVCKYAYCIGDISSNPFDKVDSPPKPPASKSKRHALSPESRETLVQYIDTMQPSPLIVAAALGLYTGMRIGEICALRWRDVDFEGETIDVHQAIKRGSGENSTYVGSTKTDKSERVIFAPRSAMVTLKKRYRLMQSELKSAGLSTSAESMRDLYVIGRIDGRYKNPTTLSKEWHALAQAAGLVDKDGRVCVFHDTRHTYATVALAGGGDLKTVQNNLGHSSAAMTADTYADNDKRAQMETARLVENALQGRSKDAL